MSGRWADAFARVPTLLAAHVELCLAALVLAILVSVPLSIWASLKVLIVALEGSKVGRVDCKGCKGYIGLICTERSK